MMRRKKQKSIRKTKKKLARPAKRTRSKASSRKKKPMRSRSKTAGVLAVEVAEVETIGDIQQDSVAKRKFPPAKKGKDDFIHPDPASH
jgi:hypothetical protein